MQFKILTLIFKGQWGLAPKFLVDVIFRPHSASSNRPLRSLNRLEFLVLDQWGPNENEKASKPRLWIRGRP